MQLVQRCLAGDTDALRLFVQTHQQQVYALCYRMLGHREDAEDTAQESLLRAVRYLASWDRKQPLTPWVMKIAANRCRTALSKRSRLPSFSDLEHSSVSAADHEGSALGEELELALETLQGQQRTCFVLFYQQELSIAEISAIMQTPSGTIKTWLHRSRNLLAERLRERGLAPHTGLGDHVEDGTQDGAY